MFDPFPTAYVQTYMSPEQIRLQETMRQIQDFGNSRTLTFEQIQIHYGPVFQEAKINTDLLDFERWYELRKAPLNPFENLTENEREFIEKAKDKIIEYSERIATGIVSGWLLHKVLSKKKRKTNKPRGNSRNESNNSPELELSFEMPREQQAKPLSILVLSKNTIIAIPLLNDYAYFGSENKKALIEKLKSGEEKDRIQALNNISLYDNEDIRDLLLDLIKDDSKKISVLAASLLNELKGRDITKILIDRLLKDSVHREFIAGLLGVRDDPIAIKQIIEVLPVEFWEKSTSAKFIIKKLFSKYVSDTLEVFESNTSIEQEKIELIIKEVGKSAIIPFCNFYSRRYISTNSLNVLNDLIAHHHLLLDGQEIEIINGFLIDKLRKQVELKHEILGIMKPIASEHSVLPLVNMLLHDNDDKVYVAAMDAIGNVGSPAMKYLFPLLEKHDSEIQTRIMEALERIYFNPDASYKNSILRRNLLFELNESGEINDDISLNWKWSNLENSINKERVFIEKEMTRKFDKIRDLHPDLKGRAEKMSTHDEEAKQFKPLLFKLKFVFTDAINPSKTFNIFKNFGIIAGCIILTVLSGMLSWYLYENKYLDLSIPGFFLIILMASIITLLLAFTFAALKDGGEEIKEEYIQLYTKYVEKNAGNNIDTLLVLINSETEKIQNEIKRIIVNFGNRSIEPVITKFRKEKKSTYMNCLVDVGHIRAFDVIIPYLKVKNLTLKYDVVNHIIKILKKNSLDNIAAKFSSFYGFHSDLVDLYYDGSSECQYMDECNFKKDISICKNQKHNCRLFRKKKEKAIELGKMLFENISQG